MSFLKAQKHGLVKGDISHGSPLSKPLETLFYGSSWEAILYAVCGQSWVLSLSGEEIQEASLFANLLFYHAYQLQSLWSYRQVPTASLKKFPHSWIIQRKYYKETSCLFSGISPILEKLLENVWYPWKTENN